MNPGNKYYSFHFPINDPLVKKGNKDKTEEKKQQQKHFNVKKGSEVYMPFLPVTCYSRII